MPPRPECTVSPERERQREAKQAAVAGAATFRLPMLISPAPCLTSRTPRLPHPPAPLETEAAEESCEQFLSEWLRPSSSEMIWRRPKIAVDAAV
jgi:hypothetical protein